MQHAWRGRVAGLALAPALTAPFLFVLAETGGRELETLAAQGTPSAGTVAE
jgi:hypothetical protein